MTKFFSLHVFYNRKDGFSIPVKFETIDDSFSEEDVINSAITQGLIDLEDGNQVDLVDEIDEDEYNLMKD